MCCGEFGFCQVLGEPGVPFSSQETKQLKLFVMFSVSSCMSTLKAAGGEGVADVGILCTFNFQELKIFLCVS